MSDKGLSRRQIIRTGILVTSLGLSGCGGGGNDTPSIRETQTDPKDTTKGSTSIETDTFSPTPTSTPTESPSPTPTSTPTESPSPTPTSTPTESPSPTANNGVIVEFSPATITINSQNSASVNIQATNADNGITSYAYTVTISNTSVAKITSVDIVGASQDGVGVNVTITEDNSTTIVKVAQGDDNNGVFSILTLTGQNPGTADLTIEKVTLGDDDYSAYEIADKINATVEVS